jgi:hypothetical protein
MNDTTTRGRPKAGSPVRLSATTKTYRVRDEGSGGVWEIDAKFWPNAKPKPEFRVYRVMGDINNLTGLKAAILNLLAEAGVEDCAVKVEV